MNDSCRSMIYHKQTLQNKILKTTVAIKAKEAAIQSINEAEEYAKMYKEVSRMFILTSKTLLKLQIQQDLDDLHLYLEKMKTLEDTWNK